MADKYPYDPYRYRTLNSTYQIKPGDSAVTLASQWGVSPQSLLAANGYAPYKVGQGIYKPLGWNNPALKQPSYPSTLQSTYKPLGWNNPALKQQSYPSAASPQAGTSQAIQAGNVHYDTSNIDTISGSRVDPVTGFSNQAGNSSVINVTFPDGSSGSLQTVLTSGDLATAAAHAGMSQDKYAQLAGYTKYGGTWVYVGSEVQTQQSQPQGKGWGSPNGIHMNTPGTAGNYSGGAIRNAHGTLINGKQRGQDGKKRGQDDNNTKKKKKSKESVQSLSINASTG